MMHRVTVVGLIVSMFLSVSSRAEDALRILPESRVLVTKGNQVFIERTRDSDPSTRLMLARDDGKIRVQTGQFQGWFLTADESGRVYLSERPEIGSEWRSLINSAKGNHLYNQRLGDGNRLLFIAPKTSSFTDARGKTHTVSELRLENRKTKAPPAEFVGFLSQKK